MEHTTNALREKLNSVVQYLWSNARDKETYHLRWFSADNIKVAGISQTEISSLLVKLDRFNVLEKTTKPGYGAGYSHLYRLGNLTDTQVRTRIDRGLADMVVQEKFSAAKLLQGRTSEAYAAEAAVPQED